MRLLAGAVLVVLLSATALATSVWSGLRFLGPAKVITGHARVIDGDTIDIAGTRIRLEGIDAPETDQKCRDSAGRDYLCGIATSKALRELVGRDSVTCERGGRDAYGRILGVCSNARKVDINAELVRRGLAVAFRRYSMRYAHLENAARAMRIGLWAGVFEHPGCFRAAKDGRPCKDVIPTS